ncbi:MBL fold metallo-hydrolase [Noviherbaspirillum saxi]|uniref:MBL fold metallo-hydrolase n=1 Tax=Noviherbaspirillum saxi TaxID=2320863 RepID=A0A3A3FN87_9BURK|nr:MBL fold metallo-hydrolase [Noviherbaspirillum saxi]RJF95925.1 MBL fold metallo-hydrolase [Noviherbaspirillum saxi]
MKITQLRNATAVLEIGEYRILVDPMLGAKGEFPPLKFLQDSQRNPTVELPAVTDSILSTVTHCLITHCQKGHFDHLDRSGKQWLRQSQIPVICTPHDAEYLRQRGLNVRSLADWHWECQPFLSGTIRTVKCTHGVGLVGMMMEHGVGYFIEWPGEPTVYLAGDTVLTSKVKEFVVQYQPQVSLIPAGGARFDFGSEIIMGIDDAIEFARLAKGAVVANHLEAVAHCPVGRRELYLAAKNAGVADRLHIPADGETLVFAV